MNHKKYYLDLVIRMHSLRIQYKKREYIEVKNQDTIRMHK